MRNFVSMSLLLLALLQICSRCSTKNPKEKDERLFTEMNASETNIFFNNEVIETDEVNPLQYENSYNGGGVAIADFNKDGLEDIYLSGNIADNKLYLNRGNFRFEDITDRAGVAGRKSWKTGTAMADVNGDGLPDIYVCHSGNLTGNLRENELFINKGNDENGIPLFEEAAKKYGLADSAFSNHASFFDYDRDGDLDMILLNHSPIRFNHLDESNIAFLLHEKDTRTGLKLYKNVNGFFEDASEEAHISCVKLNYNLGVSVSDINNDGWQDLYVSNDYLAPDYLYVNNHDGTFTDSIGYMLSATSQFSMGNDVSDINNDGFPDICTLDMLPEDNYRQKILFANDNYEIFNLRIKAGLHPQYMRNMLHLNNGNGGFSEIGQFAGVSNTDWSWAPLFADFDNDGKKDLFVTNGYYRDYTNLDFLKYMGEYLRDNEGKIQKKNLLDLVKKMPSSDQRNYAFKNTNGINFVNSGKIWGLDMVSNSNGASYGDLDNDGDLDLVVNNINKTASVFKNNSQTANSAHYISFKLNGNKKNTQGIGAKVYVYTVNGKQYQEQLVSRGFQSSVSPKLNFGLGSIKKIDSIKIIWVSGKYQMLDNVNQVDTVLELNETEAIDNCNETKKAEQAIFVIEKKLLDFSHVENEANDFKRQPLLVNAISYNGPVIAKADINGDNREDIFIGGASGQAGQLFIQNSEGRFIHFQSRHLELSSLSEDVDAVFFDCDNDNDRDLLVCSGGYDDFLPGEAALQPRLYLNDGKGNFTLAAGYLPPVKSSGGCVAAADINEDGFTDIFWGGRVLPGNYPRTPESHFFINNGKGRYFDATEKVAPALAYGGMITDAAFADMNGDGKPDLVTCGDWEPLRIWINEKNIFTEKTSSYFNKQYNGWWNKLITEDINGDGFADIIAGNYGLNTQCRVSDDQPAELFYKDFDNNGSTDPIFCFYIKGHSYPYVSRDELLDQISIMRVRFPSYSSYADAKLEDVFTKEELNNCGRLKINTLTSAIFLSNKGGKFTAMDLPAEAQFSPVFALQVLDFNHDNKKDLLIGGNITNTRIKIGSSTANPVMLFAGNGKGGFTYIPQIKSGFNIKGDVRAFQKIGKNKILIGINNSNAEVFRY